MRITSLVENTSAPGLPTEHGLSLFVEAGERRFLFDMGHTDLFARNARALGVDLNDAEFAVLSHGHYDHGGGMETFFALNDHAPVYVSPHAFEPHYDGTEKDIGLDARMADSPRIVPVNEVTGIAPGMTLYPADRNAVIAFDASGLTVLRDGAWVTEDFCHEQYLLVEEEGRRVLFSGCSHRGILNIMRRFQPDVLVGGFHLFKRPLDDDLAACADALDAFPTEYYTCHCTGTAQYEFLRGRMRRCNYLSTGESIII